MVDRIEIPSSAPTGSEGPRDQEMAKVGEELMARNGQAPPPANEHPKEPEAPLLAGKYKSAEDLEKAYVELEKKLGSSPKEAEKAAAEAVGESDFVAMQQEFSESGSLSEKTLKSLEGRGIPRAMVDAYIEGQKALADRQVQAVYSEIGGQDNYQSLIDWASKSLDAEEISAFNSEVQSGDLKRAKLAVKGLNARRQIEDKAPRRVEGRTAPAVGEVFRSMAEVVAAMRNPKYKVDPAYRADVEQKIARSGPLA